MLAARENARVWVGGVDLGGIRSTYGEADAGRPLALIGSHGRLEIAVRQGSAAGALGLAVGHEVRVY
jgi:S-adenosylmethionine hydrolase